MKLQRWFHSSSGIGLTRLVMSGGTILSLLLSYSAQAQIIPDSTLGTQATPFTPGACAGAGGICDITSGTARGNNLFHSFQQFSLPNGDIASFITNPGIQNVLVRVTGVGQPFVSNINGTIETLDPAFNPVSRNFFLLNPNGIVFGPNARLDTRGAFVASTLDALEFPNGAQFSATNPARDATLLTIVGDPSGFLASQRPIAPITLQGSRLGVESGQSLILVGGALQLDDAQLFGGFPQGGRIDLGSVAAAGRVGLVKTQNSFRLSFPEDIPRSDIQFRNQSSIFMYSENGQGVGVYAQNLTLLQQSRIETGIINGLGTVDSNSGHVDLNVSNTISLQGSSLIASNLGVDSLGSAGNIQISAKELLVTEGSSIIANTFGVGQGGTIFANIRDRILLNATTDEPTGLATVFRPGASGQSGNLILNTGSLTLLGGAFVETGTQGQGNAGNIGVAARDTITINGVNASGERSRIRSTDGANSIGNSGDIRISTGSLFLVDGGQLSTSIFNQGNAGSIVVNASDQVSLTGESSDEVFSSTIGSRTLSQAVGNGGNIQITAKSLLIDDRGGISAAALGRGNAGNVEINTQDRVVLRFGGNQTTPFSSTIVNLAGIEGQGGDIRINTGSLTLLDGATLTVETFGRGNAGNIIINARDRVSFRGTTPDGQFSNALLSRVGAGAEGDGGRIQIATRSLEILDGGSIDSSVFQGARGRGGSIILDSEQLSLTQSRITVSADGEGVAGDISIQASRFFLNNRATVKAESTSGNGGNIVLNIADLLLLRRESQLSTTAGTAQRGGNGGNITINTPRGFLVSAPLENNDITANAFTGSGGNIAITAQGIYWFTPRSRTELGQLLRNPPFDPQRLLTNDITASSQFGISGTIVLNTPNVDPSRSLAQLPQNLIDTNRILANSCIVRDAASGGTFLITGTGGLPEQPGTGLPSFPTGEVRGVEEPERKRQDSQSGRAELSIVEVQGIYQLPDGQVILSWECG